MEEKIAAFEKVLLTDLKLMRHRQVIHPVLQEGASALTVVTTICEDSFLVRCPVDAGFTHNANFKFPLA